MQFWHDTYVPDKGTEIFIMSSAVVKVLWDAWEIVVEELDDDVRFQTGCRNMDASCMRNEKMHYHPYLWTNCQVHSCVLQKNP